MIPKTRSRKSYWYGPYEGHEARRQRRLQEDLGVDEAAAETILHLRRQVLELQSQIHQLEITLSGRDASQHLRLTLYRDACYEASWTEVEIQE